VREGEPLIRIEKNDDEVKDMIHKMQGFETPKYKRVLWMSFHIRLSKALYMLM
jgi:hypothetical protein